MKRYLMLLVVCALCASGCAEQLSKAGKGALAGGAIGAGTGAIIGNQTGNAGAGVAIGAGIGAVSGAILGNSMDAQDKKDEELQGQLDLNAAQLEENRKLIDELRRRGADVRSTDRGVVINLPDILFQFDRAELTSAANRTVDEIGEVLSDVKQRNLAVEGHTDSIGSVEYNKDLSRRRAQSVARALSSRGVARSQMTVRGYGEGAPISTNNTEAGRARNRRVEIIVEN